ncbi:MAG TPA: LysM peptidoglycan-binding domain-containing protein [Chloroflexia bacterium]
MATNTLSELATYLQGQAQQTGGVTLDSTFLDTRVQGLIADDLLLTGKAITLAQVTAKNVFLSGDTLYIVNAQTPASGALLHLKSARANVAIQQTTLNNPTGYDLVLQLVLPGEWNFGVSFPDLALLEAPGYLDLATGPYFYFSSFEAAQALPSFPAPPRSQETQQTQELALAGVAEAANSNILLTGLNYYSTVKIGGIFGVIASIIHENDPLPMYGLVTSDAGETNFTLKAYLSQSTVGIGFISASAPFLGVRVYYPPPGAGDDSSGGEQEARALALLDEDEDAEADDDSYPMLLYYLGCTINITSQDGETLPFEIDVSIPDLQSQQVAVSIVSDESKPLNLLNLATVLMNSTATDISNAVKPLDQYLGTITLEQFTAIFQPSASTPLRSVQVQIGTDPPWDTHIPSPSDSGNTLKLDLSLTWAIMFGPASPTWSVSFDALLIFDPKLSFEVTVTVPNLMIKGAEHGTVTLSLSDLNTIFHTNLPIPDDLLTMSFTDFMIGMDVNNKKYTVNGTINGQFALFGTPILGLKDMVVGLDLDTKASTYTLSLDGIVSLGTIEVQTSATISNAANTDTVFSMHLVNETVGSMLNHLVHLVDPDYDISFGEPWNKLLDISLDALVLAVNVTKGTVSLTYNATIDLGFMEITGVTLTYTKGTTAASSVQISLDGTFLGQSFGGNSGKPGLGWDAINDNPPAVPGQGSSLFDLRYAGLGQHIAFTGIELNTVEDVMKALKASVLPSQSGKLPPFGQNSLAFSQQSNWLVGAEFTVMGTVSISAIFNDPNLYGILIALSGEKAKSFAGLSFEILYHKVTDTIGVYHIELKLPDAMRHLEFGEVSITLPIVILDIYTNGNFRVNFGFPKGLDFSNSFAIQVFPFVGYGGFYFALLNGATSTRVPKITNGNFSPVIEFGIALSLGVGKTVDEGILSGGITVTVIGILQGVLGWFNPTDPSPKETYYWIQGTIAIVGKLYATINFGIISASLDVTAYASVTLTIESHQPIYIAISAGVSVRVSVKIIFFTIHLSFSAHINASFTIGSASPTPWKLASGSSVSSNGQLRQLRGQQSLHSTLPLHAGYYRALRRSLIGTPAPLSSWPAVLVLQSLSAIAPAANSGASRAGGTTTITTTAAHDYVVGDQVKIAGVADRSFNGTFAVASVSGSTFTYAQAGAPDATSGGGWAANAAPKKQQVPVMALPAFTKPDVRPIATAQNKGAVRTGGTTTITTTYAHEFTAGATVGISGVADGSFNGTFTVVAVPSNTTFTYAQAGAPDATSGGGSAGSLAGDADAIMLLAVQNSINPTATTLKEHSLLFTPASGDAPESATFNLLMQAMLAWAIYAKTSGASSVTAQELDELQQQLKDPDTIAAAFDYGTLTAFLAQNFTFDVAQAPDNANETGVAVFPMVPAILLSDTAGTSIDFGKPNVDSTYQPKVDAYFQLLQVQFQARNNGNGANNELAAESVTTSIATIVFAHYFNMLMTQGVKAAGDLLAHYPYTTASAMSIAEVGAAVGDAYLAGDPARIVLPNKDLNVLNTGAVFSLADVVHQVQSGETFAGIAEAFKTAGALNGSNQAYTVTDLFNANGNSTGIFMAGTNVAFSGLDYTTQQNDTLNLVSARLLLRSAGAALLNSITGAGPAAQSLQLLNPTIPDITTPIAPGTPVKLSDGGTYYAVGGDTLMLVAAYFLGMEQSVVNLTAYVSSLLKLNTHLTVTDPTQPQPPNTQILMPTVTWVLAGTDTINSLATGLITTPALVQSNLLAAPATPPLLAPQGVLHVPLNYSATAGTDTFATIAAKFDLALADVATAAAATANLFAAGQALTINDLASVDVLTLIGNLLNQGEWNNAAGMVSRFLLSGLRLPDPNDTQFENLTPAQLLDPENLAGIGTRPMFNLTGQQYPISAANIGSYKVTLQNKAGVGWLTFGGSSSLKFGLTADQQALLGTISGTQLQHGIQSLNRLSLFQMVPPRLALQDHVAWQAAEIVKGCFSGEATTGNPSIWLFPDALISQIQNAATNDDAPLFYETMIAGHQDPNAPVNSTEAKCYAWATVVDIQISLPATDGPSPAIANAYVVEGADDVGADLLQQAYSYIANAGGAATLYLLYSPGASSANPSGLASDPVDRTATYLLKTSLSTLTHSGGGDLLTALAVPDPTSVYAASMSDAAAFLALLWEASITRSGGFYLNYVNQNGNAPLPASIFGTESSATVSLLILTDAQLASKDAAMLPFNNCVVIGDYIDTSVSSVFVQPAVYYVGQGDTTPQDGSLTIAVTNINKAWSTSLTVAQLAKFNQSLPLLLQVGASLAIPGQNPHTIVYGDTLAGIAAQFNLADVATLVNTGSNATAPILAAGSPVQFTYGRLQPSAYRVPQTQSLTAAQAAINKAWATDFTVQEIALFNQNVPGLLQVGAKLTVPGQNPYTIAYGDTLASIVTKLKVADVATLVNAGSNATTPLLAQNALMQTAAGALQPATTVPPGTTGFEITRTNPDPDNAAYSDLTPAQVVGTLFNLVGFSIAEAGAFTASGAGLPTTPSDSWQDQSNGLAQRNLEDTTDPNWYYQQTLAVGPFGNPQYGSISPALPPAEWNPYNGVGYDTKAGEINQVTINLDLQDIYGNIQQLPAPYNQLQVPAGYYDDIVSLGSWPSLAISYLVTNPPQINFTMTMQQARYIPSASVAVSTALASIAADLKSYISIYYQLSQPDVTFALQTTLDANSMIAQAPVYPLDKGPFSAFARGAYIYLQALSTMQAVQLTMSSATNVSEVLDQYGVSPAQLFETNQYALYNALFGSAMISVPTVYSTIQGDSLATIIANPKWSSYGLTVPILAGLNKDVALDPGTDLAGPTRQVTVGDVPVDASNPSGATTTAALHDVAAAAHASVAAIAVLNGPRTDILKQGSVFAVGTQTYTLGANDSFTNAAQKLNSTVEAVATANQWLQGIFVEKASLNVSDLLVADGDTLDSLAAAFATTVDGLANNNANVQNIFAPGTQVQIGPNPKPTAAGPDDSLASFAQANNVTVDQLAAANATGSAQFVTGAQITIPGALLNQSTAQYCTYTALSSDRLTDIAARFGKQPSDIVALNPDIPGLLLTGQTITDTASNKSVPTQAGDTFETIIARFQAVGASVSLTALASDVATQQNLIVGGSLWICPPMVGGAGGKNANNSLAGLAAAYNTDVPTIATANAAAIGFLAANQSLTLWGVKIVTKASDTLNSLANRVSQQTGLSIAALDVAQTVASVADLISPAASVVPIPPPSPANNGATIKPSFVAPVFQVAVNIVTTRNPEWVDPDFALVSSVSTSVYGVTPEPDPQSGAGSPFSLLQFAQDLQTAIPGIYVATGDPLAEGDPAAANSIWVANFASSFGPQINYQFAAGTGTQYFAIPPLSTALMSGTVPITPYKPGQTNGGAAQDQTFQAVDLDVWLDTFLGAVDVFLSPAYAVPAYALDSTSVEDIIKQKQALAYAISQRMQYVLQVSPQGSLADAQAAMYQAMLTQLSSAFTVSTVVQAPVTVSSGIADPLAAPRLSGKLNFSQSTSLTAVDDDPQANTFSFSTAKVSLTDPGATATFLFTVKAPAEHREADLSLQYVITELELPNPASEIDGYEGSSWLKFVQPIADSHSAIGNVAIPIPLRSYPSPINLVLQSAEQSVLEPATAADLIAWNFDFIYQHDDAVQDTALVKAAFNVSQSGVSADAQGAGVNLQQVFAALAQFMAVYPALKNDLALLPLIVPGTTNAVALAAVGVFRQLVDGVATAFQQTAAMELGAQPPIYTYQVQKDQANNILTQLTLTSIDPTTGLPAPNPTQLWPSVYATVGGNEVQLTLAGSGATQAQYNYPAGIAPDTAMQQRFVYPGPDPVSGAHVNTQPPAVQGVDLVAPQIYQFDGINILAEQNAQASVAIARNLALVSGTPTNTAFVYRTPYTSFTSIAVPSVIADSDISLGSGDPTQIAAPLGTFLKAMFSQNTWQTTDTLSIRFGAAYSYNLAGTGTNSLPTSVPILLVPSFDFHPATDWDPGNANSFVSQLQQVIATWYGNNLPSTTGGSYVFDLTIYAGQGQLQPLIHATRLLYSLA